MPRLRRRLFRSYCLSPRLFVATSSLPTPCGRSLHVCTYCAAAKAISSMFRHPGWAERSGELDLASYYSQITARTIVELFIDSFSVSSHVSGHHVVSYFSGLEPPLLQEYIILLPVSNQLSSAYRCMALKQPRNSAPICQQNYSCLSSPSRTSCIRVDQRSLRRIPRVGGRDLETAV